MVPCLHSSLSICSNLVGVLFNGLLAELPITLDGFFTSSKSDYIGVVGRGWWRATKCREIHTLCSYTSIMDPLVLEIVQNNYNITTRSCEILQAGIFCSTASRDD